LRRSSRRTKGDLGGELERLRRDGFVRVRVDGEQVDLGDAPRSTARSPRPRRGRRPHRRARGVKGRLTDSVELALKLGDGTLLVDATDGSEPSCMSERLVSWEYGITLPPLEPRLFSFNSPHGACPTATAWACARRST
jgi:excinuclease ABC subunit A